MGLDSALFLTKGFTMSHPPAKATDRIELGIDPHGNIHVDVFNASFKAESQDLVRMINRVRREVRDGSLAINDPAVEMAKEEFGVTFVDSDFSAKKWLNAFHTSLIRFQLSTTRETAASAGSRFGRIAFFQERGFLPEEAADFLRIKMGRPAYGRFIAWENKTGHCNRIPESELPFASLSTAENLALAQEESKVAVLFLAT